MNEVIGVLIDASKHIAVLLDSAFVADGTVDNSSSLSLRTTITL